METEKSPHLLLLSLVGAVLIGTLTGYLLSGLYLSLYYPETVDTKNIAPAHFFTAVFTIHLCSHLGAYFLYLRINKKRHRDIFPKTQFPFKWLVAIPILLIGGIFITSLLGELSLAFFNNNGFQGAVDSARENSELLKPLLFHNNPMQLMVSILVFAVLPAIGEEFIFRGLLQSLMIKATGNVAFAIGFSAIVFGALHWQPVNLLGISFMGVVLGISYHYTRTIWYPVLLHFLFNATEVLLVYFYPTMLS